LNTAAACIRRTPQRMGELVPELKPLSHQFPRGGGGAKGGGGGGRSNWGILGGRVKSLLQMTGWGFNLVFKLLSRTKGGGPAHCCDRRGVSAQAIARFCMGTGTVHDGGQNRPIFSPTRCHHLKANTRTLKQVYTDHAAKTRLLTYRRFPHRGQSAGQIGTFHLFKKELHYRLY